MELTAQAVAIAHLTAENKRLAAEVERQAREISVMRAMQTVVDARVVMAHPSNPRYAPGTYGALGRRT